MGLLNLPVPLFDSIDAAMALVLPAGLRLVLWAAMAGTGTVLLYRGLSPQQRIATAKRQARAARRRLNAFDGELADAGPLVRDQLATSFKQLALVLPATLLAVLPLLCVLTWADTHFGYRLPAAGHAPAVTTVPGGYASHWQGQRRPPHLRIRRGNHVLADIAMTAPVGTIGKRSAWHWVLANPVGYLPPGSPLERVRIDLPERQYLPFGPAWMRRWFALFIPSMFMVSLALYRWAKIE